MCDIPIARITNLYLYIVRRAELFIFLSIILRSILIFCSCVGSRSPDAKSPRKKWVQLFFFFIFFLERPWSQVGVVPSPLPGSCLQLILPIGFANPTARRFLLKRCHLTLGFSAQCTSEFLHKKKSPRVCTSMHSGELKLTKLIYTRLEDNLIRHWGGRYMTRLCRSLSSTVHLIDCLDFALADRLRPHPKNPMNQPMA